jgi:hypothetical protein
VTFSFVVVDKEEKKPRRKTDRQNGEDKQEEKIYF